MYVAIRLLYVQYFQGVMIIEDSALDQYFGWAVVLPKSKLQCQLHNISITVQIAWHGTQFLWHVKRILLISLSRLRASMKMSNFERKYSPEYRHIICIGKTKSTSEKGLLTKKDT